MSREMEALAAAVKDIAVRAGTRILEVYHSEFAVENKADDSPLTLADRAAHQLIVQELSRLTPELPILSEEGKLQDYDTRRRWQRYWLVDPLDGTKEFVKRNGEFTVNIALIDQHRPILGVVHAPVLGTTWYAVGGKAFRDQDGVVEPLRVRPVSGAIIAVVSRSHRGERIDAMLERIPEVESVSVGSSLKFCLVAEGKADLYPRFGPTSEWDTAAAHCVVEGAGGRVSKIDLSPLRYNTKESLLNPDFVVTGDPDHDWRRYLEGLHGEER